MNRLSILFLALVIPGPCSSLYAQSGSVQDFELWLKSGAQWHAGDRWQFDLEQQLRMDDNAGTIKKYSTEIEFKYELTKSLELIFVPRFTRRNDDTGATQGYENQFRYQLGGAVDHELGRMDIKHRLLYQNRNEMGVTEAEGDVPEAFIRYKLSAEYKIRDWKYDPEITYEYFGGLDNARAGTNNQYRLGIGTERDFDRYGEFGVSYMYERSLGLAVIEHTYILSLHYMYSF